MEIEIRNIEQGNQQAFKRFMEFYSDDLYYFAYSIIGKKEPSEEIVSDVFYDVWQKRETLSSIDKIKSWLLILTRNKAISYIRVKSNDQSVSLDDLQDIYFPPVKAPDTLIIEQEMVDRINKSIEKLPPKCKLVFTLAKIQGLKYKEIAKILDISVKTINIHIANALKFIAEDTGMENRYSSSRSREILSILLGLSL